MNRDETRLNNLLTKIYKSRDYTNKTERNNLVKLAKYYFNKLPISKEETLKEYRGKLGYDEYIINFKRCFLYVILDNLNVHKNKKYARYENDLLKARRLFDKLPEAKTMRYKEFCNKYRKKGGE